MGLMRPAARTAAVAGTTTAVNSRHLTKGAIAHVQ